MWYSLWVSVFVLFRMSESAVLLWSDQELRINPLQPFTIKEFAELADDLEKPDLHIFQSPSTLSPLLKEVLNGYYTAYTPNGFLDTENITYLLGDGDLDIIKLREVTSEYKSNNILFAINIPSLERNKREAKETTEVPVSTEKPKPISNEPVIYSKQNSTSKLYALLYSSQPLLLKINDSEDLHLGNTKDDMILYDTRLNVKVVPLEGVERGTVTLRFIFTWTSSGYWSVNSVKVSDTLSNSDYTLVSNEDISAARSFSYHCNSVTVFSSESGVELHIYDLQIQPDSRNGKFDDANDCVPFTTIPIWSGLFVTAILGIGLMVALSAIMDIKTMDKFDNYKTKNLAITVLE